MVDQVKLKAELETKLAELKTRVSNVDKRLSSPGEADWEENAIAKEDDEVLNQIGSATQAELNEVQLAIHRIDSGKYGICTTCEKQISPERLEALPFATNCINCASS